MKYLLVFLVVISFFTISTAYGIWLPQSPEELLEESQVIFVGTITSVDELELEQPMYNEDFPLILDEYTVSVEESVKNTQIPETLTVRQPTVSTPGRLLPYEGFEVGDRVLFYIENYDGINTYSKESFLIPKQCDTRSVITKPRMIGSDNTMMQNGIEKQDNFTANLPIQFTAKRDMGTLSGATLEYDVFISKQVGKTYKDVVLNKTIAAGSQPCEWLSVAKWEFTPDAGNYLLNGRVYKVMSNFSISNQFFSVLAEPPLKQDNAGIPFQEIQCKSGLELVARMPHADPACVKPESIEKLTIRGWASTDKTIDLTNPTKYVVEKNGTDFELLYSLNGATLEHIANDADANSVHVSLSESAGGQITISIPRELIDAKIGRSSVDDVFFVLIDGMEYLYGEKVTDDERIITVWFPKGTHDIEIIGTGWI